MATFCLLRLVSIDAAVKEPFPRRQNLFTEPKNSKQKLHLIPTGWAMVVATQC